MNKNKSILLYSLAYSIVVTLCFFLSVLMFLGAFIKTSYSTDMESQLVLYRFDHPLINGISLAVLTLLFCVIANWLGRKSKKGKYILLFFALGFTGLVGLFLIAFGRTMPAADAMSVFSIGESFAAGDYSAIEPDFSYLSYYPQQIGLASFYVPIIKLWNLFFPDVAAYHFIKCIYIVLMWVIILFQYKTVHLLWNNNTYDCLYLLFAGTNLPLMFYTSFVYGEIPSFAALTVAIYCLLLLLHFVEQEGIKPKHMIAPFILGLLCFTASVLLRKNSLIIIIAVVLVGLLEWLHLCPKCNSRSAKRKALLVLLFTLCCGFFSVNALPSLQRYYEKKAGNTLKTGVTATSYFAMGMQEASRAKGWYNGFNFYTYQDTGMDTEKTNEIAKESIKERLTYFGEHPDYALNFYIEKYLSQWADGTYACRQATLANSGGRKPFVDDLYKGDMSQKLISYCNAYQNLLYLGALLFTGTTIWSIRKSKRQHTVGFSKNLAAYLMFIGVLGGFLFHMLWEANSRYIFLYSLLLLPYGAAGLGSLIKKSSQA